MPITNTKLELLLTLCAKVAGLPIVGYDPGNSRRQPAVLVDSGTDFPTRWNCYHNDGDCFRLLALLRLRLVAPDHAAPPQAWSVGNHHGPLTMTAHGALRHVVTMAAAEMALQKGCTV